MTAGVGRARRRRRPTVGLFGQLGSGNVGNDASMRTVVDHLRSRHPTVDLRVMTTGNHEVADRYRVRASPLHVVDALPSRPHGAVGMLVRLWGKAADVVATVVWLVGLDVVIVPGMGVLEASVPMWAWQFPFALFTMCLAARLLGVQVALVGVGAQAVTQLPLRFLLVRSARTARYRSYRDELSRTAMHDMGVDTSSDPVFCDMVFALPVPVGVMPTPGCVGLGVMDYHGRNAATDRRRDAEIHASYLMMLSRFALRLIDSGRSLRLFVGDRVDVEVAEHLLHELRAARPGLADDRAVLVAADDFDALMTAMAQVEIVVATRYHNVVAALKVGKPTLSLGYAPKNAAMMESFGQGRFALALAGVDFEQLCDRFDELDADRSAAARAIEESSARYRTRAEEQLADLSRLLERRTGSSPRPGVPA
ncbi:membrane protein [Pseudonocardia sulfidoxydans NBRC 16205]|uniref:Membrane protein n=1 Tax=Pseudonocardia sulfidoxydans NBRC 16205 TaxID=1223511 RepID=A0A511DJB5_9PSEU|nr:polysaccharide pyruvyl transferase family protein [Pseudonocardia sulfidoxydans]GEL24517.1 membrane protein [Pseudonocardia sulfidoxydans NBRC 16205]